MPSDLAVVLRRYWNLSADVGTPLVGGMNSRTWLVRSGGRRFRRVGNRQLNAALHRIAITQARSWPPGRDYVAKRIKHRNTKAEALRLLRRRLSDVVYRTMLIDEPVAQPRSSHQHSQDLMP